MKKQQLFFGATIVFCVTIPLPIIYNNVAIYLMVLTWLGAGEFKMKRTSFENVPLIWPLLIFFLTNLLSLLYSTNISFGWKEIETKLSLLGVPLLLATSNLTRSQISLLLKIFVLGTLSTSLVCLTLAFYNFYSSHDPAVFFYHQLSETIGLNAVYLATYLTFSALIIFYQHEMFKGWLRWAAILACYFLVAMLSALSALFFLSMFLFIQVLISLGKQFPMWKTLLFACVIISSAGLVAFSLPYTKYKIERMASLHYKMDDPDSAWNSVTIRLAKWRCSWDVITAHPWVGVGAGDEQDQLMDSYAKNNFKEGIRCRYNSHNQYLSVLIATGLAGFVIFSVVILLPLAKALHAQDYLLVSFLFLILTAFITENILSVQKGNIFFSFFYSLLVIRHSLKSENL